MNDSEDPQATRFAPPNEDAMRLVAFVPENCPEADIGLQFLLGTQLRPETIADADQLLEAIIGDVGALLIAEPSLDAELLDRLAAICQAEPAWSALPVIVVSAGDVAQRERLAASLREAGIDFTTLLGSPVNHEALIVAVYAALRARELQYRFRESLLQSDPLPDLDTLARDEQGEELYTAYDTAPVGLCLLDRNLRYLRINQRLADINGASVAQHLGRRVGEIVPELAPAAASLMYEILRTGEPKIDTEIAGTTPARPGENRTWVQQWYPLRNSRGRIVGVNVIVRDITDERQAQEALAWSYRYEQQLNERLQALVESQQAQTREQKRELRHLAVALSNAENAERERIAHLLHGGLQQTLAALRVRLDLFADECDMAIPESLSNLLDDAMEMSRTLSNDLSSMVLAGASFCAELEWLVTWAKERYGIDLQCACDDLTEEETGDRLFLMQCLRELLLNVYKHAGIQSARLFVRQDGDDLVIRLEDDGKGFDQSAVLKGIESGDKAFGLAAIRSRTRALGWTFGIETEPDAGTRVSLRIPVLQGTEK